MLWDMTAVVMGIIWNLQLWIFLVLYLTVHEHSITLGLKGFLFEE